MRRNKNLSDSATGAAFFFLVIAAVVTVTIPVYGLIAEKSENNAVVAVVMLSVILFLTLTCTVIDFIRRKITVDRPVKEILDATDKIAAGDFSVRLKITHDFKHYGELDYIKENLNKMAAELSKTEVLHNDFTSNVSHELKTLLAVIQNYAAALQTDALDVETRKKYAQTLVSTSKRLTSLIMNILKLNKLENQSLTPEYTKIRLDEMLAQTILQYEEPIERKNLRLECDLDEVELVSCPDYLDIVWNNLFSNAVKFTDMGGTISVRLKKNNGRVSVWISDTGCGISKATGAHIFEKFYQGDTSHSKEGNGLGLALVKKAIDVIGGEIEVESELGKGSTFKVTLKEA